VSVSTGPSCQWSASNVPPWVTITDGGGTITGPRQLSYTVQANSATSPRSGGITIGDRVHTINQDGATPSCTYDVQPSSQNFGAGGGEGRFTVLTQPTCTWSASSGAPDWATITSAGGPGQGDVVYTVRPNGGQASRSTSITVNGRVHTVTQDALAPTCTYGVQPPSANFAAGGHAPTTLILGRRTSLLMAAAASSEFRPRRAVPGPHRALRSGPA
jgi:hypothetical protein